MAEKKKKLTPLMDQYYAIKAKYPDAILFFRLGDFYEMFDEDAKIASEVLGITLTSRDHGLDHKTPLAGVPYHSAEKYLAKLLRAGFKVAICEQVEDPKLAKKLVRREVVEVMTPGTITVETGTERDKDQFLLAINFDGENFFLCAIDILGGEFFVQTVPKKFVWDEVSKIQPAEFLVPDDFPELYLQEIKKRFPDVRVSLFEPWHFETENARRRVMDHFGITSLEGLGNFTEGEIGVAGAVLEYLAQLKKGDLRHIRTLTRQQRKNVMFLDEATVRNLELVSSIAEGKKTHTLLWSLDETQTPMGERLLRRWILSPLTDPIEIRKRHEAVQTLIESGTHLTKLRELLRSVGDMQRLAGRLGNQKISPPQLVQLAAALETVSKIKQLDIWNSIFLERLRERLVPLEDVVKKIRETIVPEPPNQINDGGIIAPGVIPELDELRRLKENSAAVLAEMEQNLRRQTGIEKLRIKYNKVFGYFIEVTRAQAKNVPPTFIRKQTLVNAERYITPELKELETKLLSADERIKYIEREYYLTFVAELSTSAGKVLDVARALAELDVLADFAHIAIKKRYVRPQITTDGVIDIRGGRHPVIEDIIGRAAFVPNDLYLDAEKQIIILTGPNMAGKSTYLRQNGLIVLMAQMGSFVPAEEAKISPVDRIFTRVGATDYIARGQSTFLVEMLETANILNNATPNSLVLLDEIGRGTSTYDGLSIAWAVAEFLHDSPRHRAKTIFATHYHELTQLASYLPRVHNFQVSVREAGGKIVFLHRIVPGGCDDSYGIQVAKLAGVPGEVIQRAREILELLESGEMPTQKIRRLGGRKGKVEHYAGYQISLFDPEYHPLVIALRELDVNKLTPLEALNILAEWKKKWER
ncbi:DNA mismatch repair protein MutS [bacterium]|nr:DNA mismatch repair protein MutS [bacterium]